METAVAIPRRARGWEGVEVKYTEQLMGLAGRQICLVLKTISSPY